MRKIRGALLATALSVAPAYADVILDPHLSGTGINVITESSDLFEVVGGFNGQNLDHVIYNDLTPGFTSASNGNDIKIGNTTAVFFEVFDPANDLLGTTTQVFSLKGTGDVTAFVTLNDKVVPFDLGVIDPNAQSGFTFTAINGEVIDGILLLDNGGMISDFEHNRIDIAAVPIPATLWLFGTGLLGLGMLQMKRDKKHA